MVVMTNGFALNHDKSLQINFICVKHQGKNNFLKDVESTVIYSTILYLLLILGHFNLIILVLYFKPVHFITFWHIWKPAECVENV